VGSKGKVKQKSREETGAIGGRTGTRKTKTEKERDASLEKNEL